MAVSQRVIFTIIPDGFTGGRARLNLHIAPRLSLTNLDQPETLEQFPAWQDWAATINAAQIRLFANNQQIDLRRTSNARSEVWAALFPQTTPVQAHQFQDLRGTDVLTYPLAELAKGIEDDYVHMAGADGDELPIAAKLGRFREYQPPRGFDRQAAVKLLNDTDGVEALSRRSIATGLLAAYHQPLGKLVDKVAKPDSPDDGHLDAPYQAVERTAMPNEAEIVERFDFHRIVAAIGQHPAVMRACGLVVPLEVRLADLPQGNFQLRVEIDWNAGGVDTEADICPRTQARRDDADFRARPRDPGVISGGWLNLDPDAFQLVAMDADGAGLSLKNFAINLPNIGEERYDDEDFGADRQARTGTPRIRTAGLQLAQTRRDRAIKALFAGSGKLNDQALASGSADLFAEDLIRGWRADIIDEKRARWQSLVRFDGRYELVNSAGELGTDDEETVIKLAAGKAADGSDAKLIKASEAVFAWSGWSLAAPQPGRVIMPDDISHEDAPNTVPDGLPLRVTPVAHRGSLPLLRFGHRYRARLRYADVAGGGVGWSSDESPVAGAATLPYRFGRYEPVEAPSLTLINGDPLPKDGESMARAALRTMDDPAQNDVSARRNVVPPRVGVRFAELHGVLDLSGRPDPAAYAVLTGRDAEYTEALVTGIAFNPADPAAPKPYDTRFATGPEASPTPYLYDPLAMGAALKIAGVPGINPEKIWKVPFVGDAWDASASPEWPNARGFSLVADENVPTGWDAVRRIFTVRLRPAERARIQLSALVPKRGLAVFKLLDRLAELAETGDAAAVDRFKNTRQAVADGRHWMFTPWRQVELVHAVQRPLISPDYQSLFASRNLGEVTANISWATPIHCKSTVRIDTDATWAEIDDHHGDGPVVRRFASDAFSRKFARLDFPQHLARRLPDEHVFTDTRARFVGYRMRATTRFREFMPLDIRVQPDRLDRTSDRLAIWVPSSSPPPAPVIRYVVPTFGWFESNAADGGKRVWREGGGLRIYLDRPWFQSGSNEMLAVLLPEVTDVPANGTLKDFVSQWGADPVWAGPKVKTVAPKRTDLPRRIDAGPVPYDFGDPANPVELPDGLAAGSAFLRGGLKPQGAPDGVGVEAVPHAVAYDAARQLWYCDIVIRPGDAYFPFVRLALARYQPHAVSGCTLSSVAMAAFQQLSPDRVATVNPVAGQGVLRQISVYGRTPTHGLVLPTAGTITVQLQRLKPGADPELDWHETGEAILPPPGPGINMGSLRKQAGGFDLARNQLTNAQRLMLRETSAFGGRPVAEQLEANPDVFSLLLPPLIHQSTLAVPAHDGDRLRVLITETEKYHTETPEGRKSNVPVERIVYAAAVEL